MSAGDKIIQGLTEARELNVLMIGLTDSMRQALADFEPGVWYGLAKPTKRAAAHKGHMVRMGLAEHDGAGPVSNYRLTKLGERVRKVVCRG